MRVTTLTLMSVLWVTPALSQTMDHSAHAPSTPAAGAPTGQAMSDMDHGVQLAPQAETVTAPQATEQAGAPPVAEHETPAPPIPTDFAADRFFNPSAMARAREVLRVEHGGLIMSKVMANLLEYQGREAGAYRWEGEAWFGSDLNRFVAKSQGEGTRREGLESAEVQALYSRAVTRYGDLQVGVRQDFKPGTPRTYATVGFETLLPFWLETQGAAFLSTKGDLLGRVEGAYDLRLSQRVILQPRAEFNFSAKDIPEAGVGSGLSRAELDLRLRYEVRREFAPYLGLTYERSYGQTAAFVRRAGQNVSNTSFVLGVRAWY